MTRNCLNCQLAEIFDKHCTIMENMKRNATKGKVRIKGLKPSDLRYKVWENVIEKHSNSSSER